jgi:hypothetical protein
VEALRRSSREIVDGSRPSRRAISRTPTSWACKITISSGSRKNKYRSDIGASDIAVIPPASRTQRAPTADDTQSRPRRPPLRFPERLPPKKELDPHAEPSMAAPVTTANDASHGPSTDACQYPSLTTFISRWCDDHLNSPRAREAR